MSGNTPILDPKRELPSPHDMLLPMTHWQKIPKKTTPHWYKWIILIVSLTLLSSIGALYVQNIFTESQKPNKITAKPTQAPSPTIIQTNNWITYSSEKGKYTLSYPPDWNIYEISESSVIRIRKVYPELGTHVDHSITVVIHENVDSSTLPVWVTKYVTSPAKNLYHQRDIQDIIKVETQTINGVSVILISGAHLPAANDSLHAYMMINNKIVEFAIDGYSIGQKQNAFDEEGKDIFFKIIPTFKFASDQQVQTEKNTLITMTSHGGLCPDGECRTITTIAEDGIVQVNNIKKGTLTEMELIYLKNTLEATDFEKIKLDKFTGTCPIAYDGQETIYEFSVNQITQTLTSCDVNIDTNQPLFKTITQLTNKYTKE